ncbi:MAG: DUF4278 domain-containing protein [Elainellaceae cyanobacterium]
MKLSYRGIQFQSPAPSAPASASSMNIAGKYRGTDFKFSSAASTAFDSALPLQYRGIVYISPR